VGEVLGLEHKGAVRQRYKLGVATRVEARVNAGSVELWHEGRRVARHKRFSRQQQVLDLEHYLDVLERKPGAQAGSTALAQWRQAGSSFPFKLVLTLPEKRRHARSQNASRSLGAESFDRRSADRS
jgi:hypothetical protein